MGEYFLAIAKAWLGPELLLVPLALVLLILLNIQWRRRANPRSAKINSFPSVVQDMWEAIAGEWRRILLLMFGGAVFSAVLLYYLWQNPITDERTRFLVEIGLGLFLAWTAPVLVFLLLDAGIDRVEKFRHFDVREWESFPSGDYFRLVKNTRRGARVRIMDVYVDSLLEGEKMRRLQEALVVALQNGAIIQIAVCDPSGPGAQERARQLAGSGADAARVASSQRRIAGRFDMLRGLLNVVQSKVEQTKGSIELRKLENMPGITLHQAGSFAYLAFFPDRAISSTAAQISVNITTSIGTFLSGRFDDIWDPAQQVNFQSSDDTQVAHGTSSSAPG